MTDSDSDTDSICTTDPEIDRVVTADDCEITLDQRPDTPVAYRLKEITFRLPNDIPCTISVGDKFIADTGRTVGQITKMRATTTRTGDVTHWVYIDYGKGDHHDGTGEGGCPLGEIAKQMANNDMTTMD